MRRLLLLFLLVVVLTACGDEEAAPTPATGAGAPSAAVDGGATTAAAAPTAAVPPTATPIPPTPTPTEPMVAMVNGEPIFESAFRREEAFFTQNGLTGETVTPRAAALDALIEKALIAQAAAELAIVFEPADVDARFEETRRATEERGGAGAFDEWLTVNGLSAEAYRDLLRYELLVAGVAERVTAAVPTTMEHVRARYIQVDDPAVAQQVLAELNAGGDFATLAQLYSLDTNTAPNGGDLGFFAAGTLLVPEVDAAAFALADGQSSDVIAVTNAASGRTVYYLVQTVERDPDRPLDFTARNALLSATYEKWLAERRAGADIQIFIDV